MSEKVSEAQGLRQALDQITATVDDGGRCHGHWHGVCVKIARAARDGYAPALSDKDWARIRSNRPAGRRTLEEW